MNNARLLLSASRNSAKYVRSRSSGVRKNESNGKTVPPTLSQLQGILTNMKVETGSRFNKEIAQYGNSDLFNYATNKQYDKTELKTKDLETWTKLRQNETERSFISPPINGFEELIRLTEEGKLWKFPIDNEQGLEAEKQVPFEDHVFLDEYLEEFPKVDFIQQFMGFVLGGLAKNSYMTVDRKREVIQFYKDYFEQKKDLYKKSGLELT